MGQPLRSIRVHAVRGGGKGMKAHGFSSRFCHLAPGEAGDWWALLGCGGALWVWEPRAGPAGIYTPICAAVGCRFVLRFAWQLGTGRSFKKWSQRCSELDSLRPMLAERLGKGPLGWECKVCCVSPLGRGLWQGEGCVRAGVALLLLPLHHLLLRACWGWDVATKIPIYRGLFLHPRKESGISLILKMPRLDVGLVGLGN